MSKKMQLLSKAERSQCEINIVYSSDSVLVEIDAWNQQFAHYQDGHGLTASGDTEIEAFDDALNLMDTLIPCTKENCTDKFHR